MNDNDFWEKYDKRKTWSTKSRMIRELFYTDQISSLNRLCYELCENTSTSLKDEGIKVVKILEQKFKTNSELNNLEYYQKLLTKHKIKSFTNFWFKDFKTIKDKSMFDYFENQIQSKYDKGSKGKFKLQVKFNIGKHIDSYAYANIGMRQPFEFSHFAFGFITDLADFNGRMLNRYPFTQIHKQQIPSVGYQILRNENGKFKFHSDLKEEVSNFYSFFQSHYDKLAQIGVHEISTSEYVSKTNELTNDNSNLWTTLSMMNIAKNEGNYEKLKSLAKLGKEQLESRSSGGAWIEYFNKYDE